ncbi:hypothetical protein [Aeromicrobium sp. UC242_57]|uniref:hypothetical protein n=1 Tax=Aeromicrobium sp. UC242_57 TaxID=3374624 RepID=UPI003795700A
MTGSDAEHAAWKGFYAEVATVAEAIAPTLLQPLPHIGDLRDQVEMAIWTDLVDEPLGTAIERRFTHDLVRGIIGTDALIGTFASLHDPSLIQNKCFLYHLIGNGTGEWRVPVGGMGAVTGELQRIAREAGVEIRTGAGVRSVQTHATGAVVSGDGFEFDADWVLRRSRAVRPRGPARSAAPDQAVGLPVQDQPAGVAPAAVEVRHRPGDRLRRDAAPG